MTSYWSDTRFHMWVRDPGQPEGRLELPPEGVVHYPEAANWAATVLPGCTQGPCVGVNNAYHWNFRDLQGVVQGTLMRKFYWEYSILSPRVPNLPGWDRYHPWMDEVPESFLALGIDH